MLQQIKRENVINFVQLKLACSFVDLLENQSFIIHLVKWNIVWLSPLAIRKQVTNLSCE